MNPLACPCPAPPGCVWADAACQPPAAAPGNRGEESHIPQHTVEWWPWGPGSPCPLASCSPVHPPAATQGLALRASLALVWIFPGAAPFSLPSFPSTPQVPAGLFTQWPAKRGLIPSRPQKMSLKGRGSSLCVAAGAGWVAGGCPHVEIPWDGQQAQAAELMGVCKERNMMGGSALSARQVLGLEGPSVKQSNSKP